MDPDRLHHPVESSEPDPDCQESESSTSTTSTADSGYGSTYAGSDATANVRTTQSPDGPAIPQSSRPSVSPVPLPDSSENAGPPGPSGPPCPPRPGPAQRRFKGLPIFNPSELQIQRHNEIPQHISPALDGALKKRPKRLTFDRQHKPKRIDAVRLVVAGESQDTARPYTVFLCNLDVGSTVQSLLDRGPYQRLLEVHGRDDLSFLCEIIQDSIQVMFFDYKYSVDIPHQALWNPTYCGIPIRLHRSDGNVEEQGRSTFGGIIYTTSEMGSVKYYAMTAGHFFDGWCETNEPGSEEDDESGSDEDISTDNKAAGGGTPNPEDYHRWSKDPPAKLFEGEPPSPWDPDSFETSSVVITAGQSEEFQLTEESRYFDWALCEVDPLRLKPNMAVVEMSGSKPMPINGYYKDLARALGVGKRVAILTASAGTVYGVTAARIAKIAIEPGRELIETHVISPLTAGISPGDSGSWVVEADSRTLLGHVVASDILGDVDYSEDNVSPENPLMGPGHDGGQPNTSTSRDAAKVHDEIVLSAISVMNLANSIHQYDVGDLSAGASTAIEDIQRQLKHLIIELEAPDSAWRSSAERVYRVLKDIKWALVRLSHIVSGFRIPAEGGRGEGRAELIDRKLNSVVRDLKGQETRLEIVLDEIQLGNPPPYQAEPPASNDILDLIKDKVDVIAGRVSALRHDDGDKDTMEELWQIFYNELLLEGFSKEVLDRNKEVIRAYTRELEMNRLLNGTSPASIRDLVSGRVTSNPSHPGSLSIESLSLAASLSREDTESEMSGIIQISSQDLMALDFENFARYASGDLDPVVPGLRLGRLSRNTTLFGRTMTRLAPDSMGREIPLDAKWTKIKRSLVSPEVLERAGVRYEARPEFVAVLGVLTRSEIMEYARLSAEARQARSLQHLPIKPRPSPYGPVGTMSSHAGSTTEGEIDPWDLDLRAWDSDLDTWDMRESSDDEESSFDEAKKPESEDDSEPKGKPIPHRGKNPVHLEPKPQRDQHRDRDRDRDRGRGKERRENNLDRDRDRNRNRDRDYDRHYDRAYRYRYRDRDHVRNKDDENRVAQKKVALKDTLNAAGIGGAAATLLSVLAEAAAHL